MNDNGARFAKDYSQDGNAWDYFTHDQSRSRAYRWGEDGLAGISDDKQQLCFALALWNGRDPILKERLFGLTNSEGNHGEDVKEYYFYLDSTPTHSYMKYLYKYPQQEFPYSDLVATNARRSREEFEYELLDTGIFDDDRYFDVFVEYAKADPEDMLIRISVHNRGPETAELHLLPTLWFRNTWSWERTSRSPRCVRSKEGHEYWHRSPARRVHVAVRGNPELLFTENESNASRLWGQPNPSPYVKDAFHEYVISGTKRSGKSGERRARKLLRIIVLEVPAGGSRGGAPATECKAGRRRLRNFRQNICGATRRGRRILRPDHSAYVERGRTPRASPGTGRNAVEQAVLLFRSRQVAG